MSKLHHRRQKCHNFPQPTLFDWLAERELRITDPVARRIARRFGLTIYHARAVALLAGLAEHSR